MRLYDVHHIDLGEIERKLMNEGQHSADSGLWEPWTGPGGRGLTLEEKEA